jgi:hypothetical protein
MRTYLQIYRNDEIWNYHRIWLPEINAKTIRVDGTLYRVIYRQTYTHGFQIIAINRNDDEIILTDSLRWESDLEL